MRVKLEKIDELPVIDGMRALPQIIKFIVDTVVGEDRIIFIHFLRSSYTRKLQIKIQVCTTKIILYW